jgi:hypothetical protein
MLYASDFSDEEGLSDDPDYYDFKRRLKANRRKALEKADLEADPAKQQAQAVFSAITYERKNEFFEELDKGKKISTWEKQAQKIVKKRLCLFEIVDYAESRAKWCTLCCITPTRVSHSFRIRR